MDGEYENCCNLKGRMIMTSSQTNIKFYTEFPHLVNNYPIYPSRDYRRNWVKDCAINYKKYKQRFPNTITAAKCPGMRSVMESGYIVQSWFDFTIETYGHEYEFNVILPDGLKDHLESIGCNIPLINSFNTKFSPMRIPTYMNLGSIIKIWTPFHIEIPEGYSLSIQPVHYDDDPPFTACQGNLSSGMNVDFNVHVYWHKTHEKIFVPAGTPLCQVVPIKNDDIEVSIVTATEDIREYIRELHLEKQERFQI